MFFYVCHNTLCVWHMQCCARLRCLQLIEHYCFYSVVYCYYIGRTDLYYEIRSRLEKLGIQDVNVSQRILCHNKSEWDFG